MTRVKVAIEPELVEIPAARFLMGREGQRSDEAPPHEVALTAFFASVRPVTNAEYDRFIAVKGVDRPEFAEEERFRGAEKPVVGVSWEDAVSYCLWMTETAGRRYRLPTEAEREWAALGGDREADWAWPGTLEAHPAYDEIAGLNEPHVPSAACENGYGLRCMAENVHEWCLDWYAKDYYAVSPVERPMGPAQGRRRVSRGGSWRHSTKFTRVTARASLAPDFRYNDFGFRIYTDAAP